MTKQEFIKRLQQRVDGFRLDEVEEIVVAAFEEIKEIIREGDELHLNNFGRFYPKEMQPRVVRGGWYRDGGQQYAVPAKRKIGLSSFPTVDRYVSEAAPARKVDENSYDIFSDI